MQKMDQLRVSIDTLQTHLLREQNVFSQNFSKKSVVIPRQKRRKNVSK